VVVDVKACEKVGIRFFQTPSAAVLCGSSIPPEFLVLITNNQNGTTMYSREIAPDKKSDEDEEEEEADESPAPPSKREVTPQQAKRIINQELKERAIAAKERWIAAKPQSKERAKAAMGKKTPPEAGSTEIDSSPEESAKAEPEADYDNDDDDRRGDEDVVLSSAILAETTVICGKCGAQNAKGLLTCNLCGIKLKVDHIPDHVVESQIEKATTATFNTLDLRWKMTVARGGDSASSKKRKAAKKMLVRLTKPKIVDADGLPFVDLLDRFLRDIEWQTEKMREGHDEESIQKIQFLGESAAKQGYNMSYAQRQNYAGKNRLASSGTGSGTQPVHKHERYTETVAGARQWNEAQYAQHNQRRNEWNANQQQYYAPTAGGDSMHSGQFYDSAAVRKGKSKGKDQGKKGDPAPF
jgi:hypothetical protein